MPLVVTVNTIAKGLRTDCNILGDNNKKNLYLKALIRSFPRNHTTIFKVSKKLIVFFHHVDTETSEQNGLLLDVVNIYGCLQNFLIYLAKIFGDKCLSSNYPVLS